MIRMTLRQIAPLTLASLIAGCSLANLAGVPTSGETTLRVIPRFEAARYAAQAVVTPYTVEDVVHLRLSLHQVANDVATPVTSGGVPITLDIPKAHLTKPIAFTKLKFDTTYRITAQAYKAEGTAPADLISTVDARSSVDVAIGRDDRPSVDLVVRLIDKPFSATTTLPGVTLIEGGYAASGSISASFDGTP